MPEKPVVLLRPAPQTISRIFTDDALRRLKERYTVIDGEADPTEIAGLRQTRVAAHVGPSVAAIGGFPDSAVGPADPDLPRLTLELKDRGVEHGRVRGIEHQVDDAGHIAFEEGPFPALAAVSGLVHTIAPADALAHIGLAQADVHDIGMGLRNFHSAD